jgi:hypothetical protein
MWRDEDEVERETVDPDSTDEVAESSEVLDSLDPLRRCLACVIRRRIEAREDILKREKDALQQLLQVLRGVER